MKWLIYGGKGWIGGKIITQLKEEGEEVIISDTRVDQIDNVQNEIIKEDPDRILCTAGRTYGGGIPNIDYLEGGKDKLQINVRDNLFAPLGLALICQNLGKHLTYLGTGCIFSYDEEHALGSNSGFIESNEPNFFGSSYSIVKGFTDQLMHLLANTVLNCRIRMPINDEPHPRCFISKITSYEKIHSVPNSMSVLREMLPIMIDMAKNKKTGTINLTNPGTISHEEILESYKKIVDPDLTYELIGSEELDSLLLSKRSNNYLETTKLESMYPVKNIKDSVQDILKRRSKISK